MIEIDYRNVDKIRNYSGKRNVLSDKEDIREQPVRRLERNKKHDEQYQYRSQIVIHLDIKVGQFKNWLLRYKTSFDRG